MLTITSHSVDLLDDPFGILTGDRYEFILHIDVPEDDELYHEGGLYIKVLYVVEDGAASVKHYYIYESDTNKYLDFDLEEEEETMLEAFCKEHLPAVDAE